jgi:hypothetical protein
VKIIIVECEDSNCWMLFPSRSALIVSLQKLNESNNYEPIIVTLKWFCFNCYLHIHQLLSSHSAFIIFTFSNYYLHIQQLLSSQLFDSFSFCSDTINADREEDMLKIMSERARISFCTFGLCKILGYSGSL